MNTMLEKEHAQKEGIGFIACMDDWKMQNFEVNYCYQFMMGLQSFYVPVKTQLFLIVNPPVWFGAIWRIMKPMLAPSFRKRVKICNEDKIAKYLQSSFEDFLPDDMKTGRANTQQMLEDFISFRRFAERDIRLEQNNFVEGSSCLTGPAESLSVSQSDGSRTELGGPSSKCSSVPGSEDSNHVSAGSAGSRYAHPGNYAGYHCHWCEPPIISLFRNFTNL